MNQLVVVGAGGMVGSHVIDAAPGARAVTGIPWADPLAAHAALDAAAAQLVGTTSATVVWTAGTATVGASDAALAAETTFLHGFLAALDRREVEVSGLVVTSSAGALYAGSRGVVDEDSKTRPVSAYGRGKLALEEVATSWARSRQTPVLLARLANIYGPRQSRHKPQGLISTLVRATLARRPVSLFMSLDTVRDYVYGPDVGRMLSELAARLPDEPGRQVKIVASHRPVTIGEVVAEVGRITRRRPLVVTAPDPVAAQQPGQTVFRSQHFTVVDALASTPLPVGINGVVRAELSAIRAGTATSH